MPLPDHSIPAALWVNFSPACLYYIKREPMKESVYFLLVWLGVTSALALALFGWDKLLAKLHRRRIPEAALLGCTFMGGSAGAALGMALFRHKTRKPLFRRFVPLCLLAHAVLLAWAALAA